MKGLHGQQCQVLIIPSTPPLPLLSLLILALPAFTVSSQPRAVSSLITYRTTPSPSLLTITQSIAAQGTSPHHSVVLGTAATVSGESVMT